MVEERENRTRLTHEPPTHMPTPIADTLQKGELFRWLLITVEALLLYPTPTVPPGHVYELVEQRLRDHRRIIPCDGSRTDRIDEALEILHRAELVFPMDDGGWRLASHFCVSSLL